MQHPEATVTTTTPVAPVFVYTVPKMHFTVISQQPLAILQLVTRLIRTNNKI